LLADVDVFAPNIPRKVATTLHMSLHAFQNEQRNISWVSVRIIRDRNLCLTESGLHIYLGHEDKPTEGYRLAANYCENFGARYGNSSMVPAVDGSKR
jgi:hypothetical protein